MRADLVRAPDDRGDVLDLSRLEEDMRDRHEKRALVDCLDDRGVVGNDDGVELRLRLVEVADAREVALLVHDPVPARVHGSEARENDRLCDRDVLRVDVR